MHLFNGFMGIVFICGMQTLDPNGDKSICNVDDILKFFPGVFPSFINLDIWGVSYSDLGLPCSSAGKESACSAGDLGWEDPLEKEMATHSRILAWRIPWTEEPGRLQSMGLQRV